MANQYDTRSFMDRLHQKEQAIQERVKATTGGGKTTSTALATLPDLKKVDLSNPDTMLSMLGQLNNLLNETYSVADTLAIKDRAAAYRFLADRLEMDKSIRNRAAESCVRAERRLGELLLDMDKNVGGNPNWSHDATGSQPPTYSDMGINKTSASRWQTIAQLPDHKFNAFIERVITDGDELTSGGVLAYARNVVKGGNDDDHSAKLGQPDSILRGDPIAALESLRTLLALGAGRRIVIKVWLLDD